MTNHPPRSAAWLVDLFTPCTQAEAIPGDLLEEFSQLSSTAGLTAARRWYWRQSVKTVAHLFADGFRSAPWRIAGVAVAAFLLDRFIRTLSQLAVIAILTRYPVYHYIDAYKFWVIYAIVGQRMMIPMLSGAAAIAVKGREMVAAVAFGLLSAVLHAVALVPYLTHLSQWSDHGFPRQIVAVRLWGTVISPIMMVIGAGLARKLRFAATR